MYDDASDVRRYRRCCTIDGRSENITCYRRNGIAMPLLTPDWQHGGPIRTETTDWREQPRLYVNLNPLERSTWEKILRGYSIKRIAAEEGVSRPAIYSRIEGTGGYGGMISKNFWVLLWWRCRRGARTKG